MKVNPQYSYEFNQILNQGFSEQEQIKNFASLLSDKDRFIVFLDEIEKNTEKIEKTIGFELPEAIDCYVVRCEKFKSFSMPITVEYSIFPEEMVLFLLKEILKTSIDIRFPDEETREQYVNSAIEKIVEDGWTDSLKKYTKLLHDESKRLYSNYEKTNLDLDNKNLNKLIEELYN